MVLRNIWMIPNHLITSGCDVSMVSRRLGLEFHAVHVFSYFQFFRTFIENVRVHSKDASAYLLENLVDYTSNECFMTWLRQIKPVPSR
jgi:hypothetical protein